jgi:hypothetical protein
MRVFFLVLCAPVTTSSSTSRRPLRDPLDPPHPLRARRRLGEDRPPITGGIDGTGAGHRGGEIDRGRWDSMHQLWSYLWVPCPHDPPLLDEKSFLMSIVL